MTIAITRSLFAVAVVLALAVLSGGTAHGGTAKGFGTGTLWHEDFCYGQEVCMSGDFNGDSNDDVIAFTHGKSGDVWVGLSNGDSFDSAAATVWHEEFCFGAEVCNVGDFDGDGRDDIAAFDRSSGDVYVALSNGTTFAAAVLWNGDFCYGEEVCGTGDFDGNGSDDVYAFLRGSTGDVYVGYSTDVAFTAGTLWHEDFCYYEEVCTTGDFDGDGKDDIVAFTRQGFGDNYVARSTGVNFGAATLWSDDFCYGEEVCTTGDFDDDGMDDLIAFTRSDSGDVYVALSNGSAFALGTLWHGDFCYLDEVCGVGDFDGDGAIDIAAFLREEVPTPGAGDIYVALAGAEDTPSFLIGDVDCDEDVDTVDALKQARHVAALPVSQEPGCIDIGMPYGRVAGAGISPLFGDVDCDADVDAVDALKVLRYVAGLTVTQTEPCTDIGFPQLG